MRERFDASDESCRLRFHTQTGGVTLTAQQPLNNVVRVTLQALAAVLGGTQSLHTNSYDEALALPTEQSAHLALRTQQVIAHESGVADTIDPLAGSWYVESLTDRLEAEARAYLEKVDEKGGAARAISWFQDEIHQAAYAHQLAVESGEREVVGVNVLRSDDEPARIETPAFQELEAAQKARVRAVRERRDPAVVTAALDAIRDAARGDDNLLPLIVDAVKALATLGEISDVLRAEWGVHGGVAGGPAGA
jgi:methylmalonyl-CoA mutase N-terminal domain/subunit